MSVIDFGIIGRKERKKTRNFVFGLTATAGRDEASPFPAWLPIAFEAALTQAFYRD